MQVSIREGAELKIISKALRKSADGKALKLEMTRALRKELKPIVAAVKAAYGGGVKLRPALARATRGQVKTTGKGAGARVMVDGRKMPAGMGRIPRYREGSATWRHPVFGDTDVWVTQPPVPVFYNTVAPFVPQVVQAFDRITGDVLKRMVGD